MARVSKGTRYFNPQVTQRGKAVFYYRRPGFSRIRLDAEPGTAAMDRAYYAPDKATKKLAEAKATGTAVQPEPPKLSVSQPRTRTCAALAIVPTPANLGLCAISAMRSW